MKTQAMRKERNSKNRIIICIALFLLAIAITSTLYIFNIIPHRQYTNADFGIATYFSNIDKDNDSIDDQTDILQSVRKYLSSKPKYKSKYYATGYPDDEYGVCTDVVAFGLKGAGYDLMILLSFRIISELFPTREISMASRFSFTTRLRFRLIMKKISWSHLNRII